MFGPLEPGAEPVKGGDVINEPGSQLEEAKPNDSESAKHDLRSVSSQNMLVRTMRYMSCQNYLDSHL